MPAKLWLMRRRSPSRLEAARWSAGSCGELETNEKATFQTRLMAAMVTLCRPSGTLLETTAVTGAQKAMTLPSTFG